MAQIKGVRKVVDASAGTLERGWEFDLDVLRKRYKIDKVVEEAAEARRRKIESAGSRKRNFHALRYERLAFTRDIAALCQTLCVLL